MSDLNFKLQLAGPRTTTFTPIAPVQAIRVMDQGIRMIAEIVDGDGAAVNIRTATIKTMRLMLPDGTTDDVMGTLFTNGADGKMYFVSSAIVPPFNQIGKWLLQARVVIGGISQSTKTIAFVVEPNIDSN